MDSGGIYRDQDRKLDINRNTLEKGFKTSGRLLDLKMEYLFEFTFKLELVCSSRWTISMRKKFTLYISRIPSCYPSFSGCPHCTHTANSRSAINRSFSTSWMSFHIRFIWINRPHTGLCLILFKDLDKEKSFELMMLTSLVGAGQYLKDWNLLYGT